MIELAVKAVQVVLAIGILALGLTGLASCFAGSTSHGEVQGIEQNVRPASRLTLPDYRVIADRNLFQAPVAPVQEVIEETQLQIELVGTLAAASDSEPQLPAAPDPAGEQQPGAKPMTGKSAAVIRDTSGQTVMVAVGESFAGGQARLISVEPRRIVFEHRGKLESLQITDRAAGATQSKPSLNQLRAKQRQSFGNKRGRTPTLALVSLLGTDVQMAPATDDDGRLEGYQIMKVAPRSAFSSLSLQAGDRIVAVNGEPIESASDDARAAAILRAGADVSFTVETPNGSAREVTVPRAILQQIGRRAQPRRAPQQSDD